MATTLKNSQVNSQVRESFVCSHAQLPTLSIPYEIGNKSVERNWTIIS